MIFKPCPLSMTQLDEAALVADKQRCRRIGPCGVGRRALYLNSLFIDRRYYVPFSAITRVFKCDSVPEEGFPGKGLLAGTVYLMVEYDGGRQQVCSFRYEDQADELLRLLRKEHPEIPCVSEETERRLTAERARRAAEVRSRPPLSVRAEREIAALGAAMDYLNDRPELVKRLSRAAGRRRSYQCASRNYRVAAVAVTLLGAASFVYGAVSLVYGGALAAHFLLFGLIALLLTVRSAVRQPRRKHSAVARADAQAKAQMQAYLDRYPDFPLPACYAHPIVLRRMQRVIADGRAEDAAQALQTVKADLKAMNAEVRVSQEEYDEIAVIKPLFLNESYR